MLPAFLATIFFSLSVLFASRAARALGGPAANLARITLATILLALWAHTFGAGFSGPALGWFFLSGVIGFGLGDIALFGTLERLGPRLAILLTQCLGAPIAAAVEWAWLGTRLDAAEMTCAGLILVGVAFALAPDKGWECPPKVFAIGVLFGIGSALGQALGAVLSRKANLIAAAADFSIDGWSAAYQRILGGLILTALFTVFVLRRRARQPGQVGWPAAESWRKAWPLVVGNGLAGPTIGVGCFQWALSTTPSAIVLPVVAISPLVTMLLAFFFEGIRPRRRSLVGSILAVGAAVWLARLKHST